MEYNIHNNVSLVCHLKLRIIVFSLLYNEPCYLQRKRVLLHSHIKDKPKTNSREGHLGFLPFEVDTVGEDETRSQASQHQLPLNPPHIHRFKSQATAKVFGYISESYTQQKCNKGIFKLKCNTFLCTQKKIFQHQHSPHVPSSQPGPPVT